MTQLDIKRLKCVTAACIISVILSLMSFTDVFPFQIGHNVKMLNVIGTPMPSNRDESAKPHLEIIDERHETDALGIPEDFVQLEWKEKEMLKLNNQNRSGLITTTQSNSIMESNTNNVKTILYWTKAYREDWTKREPTGRKPFKNCKFTACELISDKTRLKSADMLLFFNLDTPNFPKERNPHQIYVHIGRDPPRDPEEDYLEEYEDQINLTSNYRLDSDIPKPNGQFFKKDDIGDPYTIKVPLSLRNRSVAWIVSHCVTPSQRRKYVDELRKYIDVDIYGKCGNLTCPISDGNSFCFGKLEQQYKFYLSFENRFCKDYFTEKLMYPLHHEIVPVVLGYPDYINEVGVPPNSIINAQDFKSPKDLAEYLHNLSVNEKEYYKYFEWKATHYLRSKASVNCDLCETLHTDKYRRDGIIQPSYKRSKAGNYREWWQGACEHDRMDKLRVVGNW